MENSRISSRARIRSAFLISASNDLDIIDGGIQNAYLNDPTKKKLVFYASNECKSDQWILVLIIRDIYGLKSCDLDWRNQF